MVVAIVAAATAAGRIGVDVRLAAVGRGAVSVAAVAGVAAVTLGASCRADVLMDVTVVAAATTARRIGIDIGLAAIGRRAIPVSTVAIVAAVTAATGGTGDLGVIGAVVAAGTAVGGAGAQTSADSATVGLSAGAFAAAVVAHLAT